jgi:hypothetical protein
MVPFSTVSSDLGAEDTQRFARLYGNARKAAVTPVNQSID